MTIPVLFDMTMQRAIEHPEDAPEACKALRSQWHTLTGAQRQYAQRIAEGTSLDAMTDWTLPDDTCWHLHAVMDHYGMTVQDVAEETGRSKWTIYTWRNSDTPGSPSPEFVDSVITMGQAYDKTILDCWGL